MCVSLFSPSLVEQNLKCLEGLLIFQNHTYPVVRKAAQENLTGLKDFTFPIITTPQWHFVLNSNRNPILDTQKLV